MKAKRARRPTSVSEKRALRRTKPAKVRASAKSTGRPESRELLAKAFSHPEGSSDRLQDFSEYLNALHDEHVK
jgi:hypothetical protein